MDPVIAETGRTLPQIREELLLLQRQVGTLATETMDVRPTVRLLLRRAPLHALEQRLTAHHSTLIALDAELSTHCEPPSNWYSASGLVAQMQFYFSTRDSVRALIADTRAALSNIENDLAFRGSLTISIVALIVSVITAVFQ
jgi:hypothetical protein